MPWLRGDPFEGELGAPPVPGYCALYRKADGHGHCAGREHPYYLKGCNVWPDRPEQLNGHHVCVA